MIKAERQDMREAEYDVFDCGFESLSRLCVRLMVRTLRLLIRQSRWFMMLHLVNKFVAVLSKVT